jgi:tetratricopeptide (TPR) repeat protein
MKRIFAAVCLVAGLCAGAQAGLPVREKLIDDLFVRLRQAEDVQSAAQFRAMIGEVWSHSGSPTADLLMSRAETALRGQKGELANRLLDRVVALYPDWGQAWRRRAQSALAQGDRDDAVLDLDKALSIEPRDFLAMRQLSELLRDGAKKQKALDLLRRAAELDPQDPVLAHEVEDLTREVEGRGI